MRDTRRDWIEKRIAATEAFAALFSRCQRGVRAGISTPVRSTVVKTVKLQRPRTHGRLNLRRALVVAWLCCLAPCLFATSTYSYQSNEYVVVPDRLSPDGKFSIAAHGSADDTDTDKFHIYLMDARQRKKIGVLEEVTAWLDTGATAYPAAWSPHSPHVAIAFRWERNAWDLVIYRIENRRAMPIKGPELLAAAAPGFGAKGFSVERHDSHGSRLVLKWIDAQRFELIERTTYKNVTPNPSAVLGKFAKCEKMDEGNGYLVVFSAVAVCEFSDKNKYRIVSIKPGRFEE